MNTIATGQYKNLDNQEYWNERTKEKADKKWKQIKNIEKELQNQYLIALDEIQRDLADFYSKWATEKGITFQAAVKELNSFEIGNFASRMTQLKLQAQLTNNPLVIAEMEKLSKMTQMVRLQTLMAQIDGRLLLMGHTQQLTIEAWLLDVYESSYYETGYMLNKGTGMGIAFAKLNEEVIKEAITFPWSGDQFSERIWSNRNKLVVELRQTITTGMITGKSNQKMARELRDKMDSSYSNALRLVRTETANVMSESTSKGYVAGGLDSYVFLGTLDNKMSKICQKLDGKVFKIEDRQVGVNVVPAHVNCRSSESPYFDGIELGERISKLEDGTVEYVPNMNYEEWFKKYVK